MAGRRKFFIMAAALVVFLVVSIVKQYDIMALGGSLAVLITPFMTGNAAEHFSKRSEL